MNPSLRLCKSTKPSSTTSVGRFRAHYRAIYFCTPSPSCKDPRKRVVKHLIGTSSVITARSLGEVIRLHVNRLLPIALQQVTDDRHCTTRSQQPVLLSRLFEDSSRRPNELLASRASRFLAVLASMTRRRVRRLRLATRHSAVTTPPTWRRQATVIPTPVAPAFRTTSNALPTDLDNESSCHPAPSQL
jgi:hypothetical protein